MGRKNSILLGMTCVLVSNTALGLLALIPDADWRLFLGLSIVARFV